MHLNPNETCPNLDHIRVPFGNFAFLLNPPKTSDIGGRVKVSNLHLLLVNAHIRNVLQFEQLYNKHIFNRTYSLMEYPPKHKFLFALFMKIWEFDPLYLRFLGDWAKTAKFPMGIHILSIDWERFHFDLGATFKLYFSS